MRQEEDAYAAEFVQPERNYEILLGEMKKRIQDIQLDMLNINDPEILGAAQKIYTDLKIQYFKLMKYDLELQKLFEPKHCGECEKQGE